MIALYLKLLPSKSRLPGTKAQLIHMFFFCKWPKSLNVGTCKIFRSDVLGQVMPLVGRDWSHSGVARLFSAIKVLCFLKNVLFYSFSPICLCGIIPNFVLISMITFYVWTRKMVINYCSLVLEQLFRRISRRASSSIWNRYDYNCHLMLSCSTWFSNFYWSRHICGTSTMILYFIST